MIKVPLKPETGQNDIWIGKPHCREGVRKRRIASIPQFLYFQAKGIAIEMQMPSNELMLQRVGFLTNHPVSVPAIQTVVGRVSTVEVAVFNELELLEGSLRAAGISVPVRKLENAPENWKSRLLDWVQRFQPDLVMVMSFPMRIPVEVLNSISRGVWNFHLGKLPEFRGADALFWQIRNREAEGAITVHRMEAEFDTGPVFRAYAVPIRQRDTYGIHLARCSAVAANAAGDLLQVVSAGGDIPLQPQSAAVAQTYPRPQLKDCLLDWNRMTAVEADALIRACNPQYGGAKCQLDNRTAAILTANPLPGQAVSEPGNLFYRHGQGVQVVCKNRSILNITTLQTVHGVFFASEWLQITLKEPNFFEKY